MGDSDGVAVSQGVAQHIKCSSPWMAVSQESESLSAIVLVPSEWWEMVNWAELRCLEAWRLLQCRSEAA